MGSEIGNRSPAPHLLDSSDPFFGFSDPSPDDNGSIGTPADNVDHFPKADFMPGSMLASTFVPDSDFNLDDFKENPDGLRIAQDMQNASWLDDFLIDVDHALEAQVEGISSSLQSLDISCSRHRTGRSVLTASEPCSEKNNEVQASKAFQPYKNAVLDRMGIGAQFASALPVDPKNHLFETNEPVAGVAQWKTPLICEGVERFEFNLSTQSNGHGVEEWLEQLSAPWRPSDSLRPFLSYPLIGPSLLSDQPIWNTSPPRSITLQRLEGFPNESLFPQGPIHNSLLHTESLISPHETSILQSDLLIRRRNHPSSKLKKPQSTIDPPFRNNIHDSYSDLGSDSIGCASSRISLSSQLSQSSHLSVVSQGSGTSWISAKSHASWFGRKGKKTTRESNLQTSTSNLGTEEPRTTYTYSCTWCNKSFAKKSDWRRHEESQHAPQFEWVCMPQGPPTVIEGGVPICLFCQQQNPDELHLTESHGVLSCLKRKAQDRRYDRKDHLVQHLRRWHKTVVNIGTLLSITIRNWQQPVDASGWEQLWDCGFCDSRNMTWLQRYEHVAKHMENGQKMTAWHQTDYHCPPMPTPNPRFSRDVPKRRKLSSIF